MKPGLVKIIYSIFVCRALSYSGCEELYRERKIVEIASWAHVRWKHFDAQSSDPMRSTVVLANIRLLCEVEREAGDLCLRGEARKFLQQARSVSVLQDIKAYVERQQSEVLPKSPEGAAIAYTLSNWKALIRYCDDGDPEIYNGAERSLRGIAAKLDLLRKRQWPTDRRWADYYDRLMQTDAHRSFRIHARHLSTYQQPSTKPPQRTATLPRESCPRYCGILMATAAHV
jgi:hypothetical protein